ncbi:hypothetical protein M501DRAFT_1016065 [Patellaria atrata CBS 101060]|uniref:Uncharacterized protein n=1 Tax=Patellaria atrata CBS 101060 TaxID=1346257 RepID=A0A9P4SCA2_9PEZI|nr:hypothetical protein M501DRAFT_1016065 [Patellaria atrata CBS 101060]
MDAGDWIISRNPHPSSDKSISFVGLNDIIGERLEFVGRDDGTIWVCRKRVSTGALPALGQVGSVDAKMIAKLTGHGYRSIRLPLGDHPDCLQELQVVSLGRAFRPSTGTGRPMMDEVKSCLLIEAVNTNKLETGETGNVFVC